MPSLFSRRGRPVRGASWGRRPITNWSRRLRVEALEERVLLATFAVRNDVEAAIASDTAMELASIHGQKFEDLDGDGVHDPGEPGLDGWTIELLDDAGSVIATTVTASVDINNDGAIDPETEQGLYWFENLPTSDYEVRQVAQQGWIQTFPDGAGQLRSTWMAPDMVKDIHIGSGGIDANGLVEINGLLFFAADDGVHGKELWVSDGTEDGTFMIKDINPGSGNSHPQAMTMLDGTLYFTADDGVHGWELWKSDLTDASTVMVKDIAPGEKASHPSDLIVVGSTLFFVAFNPISGAELWRSDGTEAGTMLVKDIIVGPDGPAPSLLTNVNGTLFFRTFNRGLKTFSLWKSDGSDGGTVQVNEGFRGFKSLAGITALDDRLVFMVTTNDFSEELWVSDGTTTGTIPVKAFPRLNSFGAPGMVLLNGMLFFGADDGATGIQLWGTDGTELGTVMVSDFDTGVVNSFPQSLSLSQGMLFFILAVDGKMELWKSDGTRHGTSVVRRFNGGLATLAGATDGVFFRSSEGSTGSELWFSAGTIESTRLVFDLIPGMEGSVPLRVTPLGDRVYFTANDGIHGRELWKLDMHKTPATHPVSLLGRVKK